MKVLLITSIFLAGAHAAYIRGPNDPECKGRDKAVDSSPLWCKCSRKNGLIKEETKDRCAGEPERVGKCKFEGGVCVPAKAVAAGAAEATTAAPAAAKPAAGTTTAAPAGAKPASASGSGQVCCQAPGLPAKMMNQCRAQFKPSTKCGGGGAPKGQKAGPTTTAAPAAASTTAKPLSKVQQMAAKIDAGKLGTDDTKKIAKDLGTGDTDGTTTTKAPAAAAKPGKLSAAQLTVGGNDATTTAKPAVKPGKLTTAAPAAGATTAAPAGSKPAAAGATTTAAPAAAGGECKGRDKAVDSSPLWCKCSRKNGLIKEETKDRCAGEPERVGKCKFEGGVCVPAKAAAAGVATTAGASAPAATSTAKPAGATTTAAPAAAKPAAAATTAAPVGGKPAAAAAPAGGDWFEQQLKIAQKQLGWGVGGPEEKTLKKDLVPAGTTCVKKTPVKGKPCTKEADLVKLKTACAALAKAGGKPMFVMYPKEAAEASSNCWLCDSTETRPSKMTKAFLYKSGVKEEDPEDKPQAKAE